MESNAVLISLFCGLSLHGSRKLWALRSTAAESFLWRIWVEMSLVFVGFSYLNSYCQAISALKYKFMILRSTEFVPMTKR